ncbi:uncharacterized protein SPPG_04264 [Spizellomyces punctatus DAOM BR117]|uniref:YbaK/aminoacyl-tRNA synthetase-associated domain-containing protein n=1 Tax=Spizellomyces punctatus (strain DAOM BR117) TaxID=645134 RepID=A0A0L0HJH5_SPIPD|nr:uncharacterized protein SPPG_04264 [Spizellomyces punctatus DAOM BR117]KND01173.1 hypothetical protein SPPG_04264 [Spizellomyces punctatus DAOM BR117]|eukprot:XP_016609212.1 hypothetical protein SPPG_04264 [Spizellomyces punctatus DAOM BR117]
MTTASGATTPSTPATNTTDYMNQFRSQAEKERLPEHAPDGVQRVEQGTRDIALRNCSRFYEVESDYYDWTLERRAARLNAPSIAHLCKTILFENTKWKPTGDTLDPVNSQFYCVVVQYVDKMNAQKLMNFVRDLGNKEIPRKHYNMRVASEEKNMALTGYETGGVTPFGMKANVPIIITKNMTMLEPPILYLGAGHRDWKIALPIDDFITATKCYVADLEASPTA